MSNFHRDPLSYSRVGCSVHQRPCSLAGCLARVLFKPFCVAQASSALACTVTNPGTGRRGSSPALPAQVIQKRDGPGGRKKSQHLAKPQPPSLAPGGQLSGSAPRRASPRPLPPGEPLPAPRRVPLRLPNRPGSLRVAATDPATPSPSRGAARSRPVGAGRAGAAGAPSRRGPGTPRPGYPAERAPRSHSAEGRGALGRGQPGQLWPKQR